LYVRLCTQPTIIGFFQSIYLAPTPHCQALRWAIFNGGSQINCAWTLYGTYLITFLLYGTRKNKPVVQEKPQPPQPEENSLQP